MSLAPIPARMLHDTVTFFVVKDMDRYQKKIYDEYTVNNVHLQSDNLTIKKADDSEVQLKGILFVDGRRSLPEYDLNALQNQSLANGDTMRAKVYDADGNESGDFAVLNVDSLPDVPATRIHHYEITLI